MVSEIIGASIRAILVALLIATPSVLLPTTMVDTAELVIVLALLASILTFVEYYGQYPSVVEFRFAAPVNRIKFGSLWITVIALSLIMRGQFDPTGWTVAVTNAGSALGQALDFKYSPVTLMVLMLPENSDASLIETVRALAGFSYMMSLLMLFVFVSMVRLHGWPVRNKAFNVWVNLPFFDPTRGGDILFRLKRDAGLNIVLGITLPFCIPLAVKASAGIVDPLSLANPQTLTWIITAWAFLPASMLMRGIAMSRVAELVQAKRRRAHAKAQADGLLSA